MDGMAELQRQPEVVTEDIKFMLYSQWF